MAAKPNSRNWNDVQTAIATVAIVTTLGMWNLFATPKPKIAQASEPVTPPSEPPVEADTAASAPTPMPQVKIIFTPGVTAPAIVQQSSSQTVQTKKKKNKSTNNTSSGSVTQTKTS